MLARVMQLEEAREEDPVTQNPTHRLFVHQHGVTGQWDWTIKAANGQYICGSGPQGGQGYSRREGCMDTLNSLFKAVRRGTVEGL